MYDVIIIGGGPSGMMAAITVSNNKKVLLIDKNEQLGKKLEITGGGRCNLLNLKKTDDFLKEIPVNAKFLYSIFSQFNPNDIYNFFIKKGVRLKVEENDRVFPANNKSVTIINCLLNELNKNNITIKLRETVKEVKINNDIKEIITNKGTYKSNKIILATGGISYSYTGSSGDGYKFAIEMGHNVTSLYPVETFLITQDNYPLSGLSVDKVELKFNKMAINDSILFTHKGISGPAVLKVSEYVYKELQKNKEAKIIIDFVPGYNKDQLINLFNNYDQKKEVISFVRELLSKRLADYIIESYFYNDRMGNIKKADKIKLLEIIKNFEIGIKRTGPLETSFVTGGGIDLKEINPKTLESKIEKGLYFVGEVLDIHGPIGGYNITIALATGYVAGKAI